MKDGGRSDGFYPAVLLFSFLTEPKQSLVLQSSSIWNAPIGACPSRPTVYTHLQAAIFAAWFENYAGV